MFCFLLSLFNRRNIRRIALTLPHTSLPRSGFRTRPMRRRLQSTRPVVGVRCNEGPILTDAADRGGRPALCQSAAQ